MPTTKKCIHNRLEYNCVDCKGKGICEHNKRRNRCIDCKGSGICEHNKQRARCRDCKGSGICEHNKRKETCVECQGTGICEHDKQKYRCVECQGAGICEHNRLRIICVPCHGSSICEHNRLRICCVPCKGSQICEHNKVRSVCVPCKGGSICEHNKQKNHCITCNLLYCLVNRQRRGIRKMIKSINGKKTKHSIEYLDCPIEKFKEFIEKKMTSEMTWDNIELDHIKPITKFNLENHEEFLACCHYTNFQPLTKEVNNSKNNKWSDADELFWLENIKGKDYIEIYLPN